jgi:hypothetical protein
LLIKNINPLFQRVRNSKKIYDTFFITGYSFESMAPTIEYCFPLESKHFEAILMLVYSDSCLKPSEGGPLGTKSPRLSNKRPGRLEIKDRFVMLLCKNANG